MTPQCHHSSCCCAARRVAHIVCVTVAFSRWSTNTARVVRNDCSGSSRSAPNAVSENLTPMKSDKPRWLTNYISFPRWIDKTNAKEKLRKAKVKTLYYRGQGPDSDVARGTRGSCPPQDWTATKIYCWILLLNFTKNKKIFLREALCGPEYAENAFAAGALPQTPL